jgi:peptidoglycan/xylan/chitin deacetylase (PgdA/CDA1 family)
MHVTVTFDDGHVSNAKAFEFLSKRNIVPTAFIVKSWAQGKSEFLSADVLRELAGICHFGAHGATHADLTKLPDAQLCDELRSSRAFVEDTIQRPVDSMALPGGQGDKRVFAHARTCGYRLVGDSVHDIYRGHLDTVQRVCITLADSAERPLELIRAPRSYWLGKRLQRVVVGSAEALLGKGPYRTASASAKRLLGR